MEPREWRSLPEHDVAAGHHLPPSSNRVPDSMRHFEVRDRQQREQGITYPRSAGSASSAGHRD